MGEVKRKALASEKKLIAQHNLRWPNPRGVGPGRRGSHRKFSRSQCYQNRQIKVTAFGKKICHS